jgi:hypothetical protein
MRTRLRVEEVEVVEIEFRPWVGGLDKPHWDAYGPSSQGYWRVSEEHLLAIVESFDVMLRWDDEENCVVGHYDAKGKKFRQR